MREILSSEDGGRVDGGGNTCRVVVFTVGKEHFALPVEALAEIYRSRDITPVPLAPRFLTGVVSVHGQLASVLSLSEMLGERVENQSGLLLILTPEFGGVALLVEKTTGFSSYSTLEEVAVEQAPPAQGDSLHFVEGVFRDKGTLVTLINPEKLLVWIDREFSKEEE